MPSNKPLTQEQKLFIDDFARQIKDDSAAIFAGAGLSIPAGYVSWKNLLRGIAAQLGLNIDVETDLIAVAQYSYNENGGNRYQINQALITEFIRLADITVNHKILSSLPIRIFWTTNYDRLIERAIEDAGKTPDVKLTSEGLARRVPRRDAIVYKMHGDVQMPEHAVVTRDDYEGYNEKRQLFTTALQGDLVSKTFLFIGFSFDDPNLNYILSRMRILLGENKNEHYCFLRRPARADFKTQDDFNYANIVFNLKVRDLKRYGIRAVLIDTFEEITQILEAVRDKVVRSNILISGAAETFEPQKKDDALKFIHHLAYQMARRGYKIISGVGYGVGGAVINGVTDFVFSTKYRHLDNSIVLRPFPRMATGNKTKEEINREYREEIVSHAGIALFIYGNKSNGDGTVRLSEGMKDEFDMAVKKGAILVPAGATGYMAQELWNKVMAEPEKYYGDNIALVNAVKKLGPGPGQLTGDELINQIFAVIELLNRN